MTPEKDAILRQKYPKIFSRSEFSSEPLDMWGFECADGWFNLIDTLCNKIQKHIDQKEKEAKDPAEVEGLQVVAQQVKEKFGGLDRKSTRLNSSHVSESRMPSSA